MSTLTETEPRPRRAEINVDYRTEQLTFWNTDARAQSGTNARADEPGGPVLLAACAATLPLPLWGDADGKEGA
jgi:hypothetical protein